MGGGKVLSRRNSGVAPSLTWLRLALRRRREVRSGGGRRPARRIAGRERLLRRLVHFLVAVDVALRARVLRGLGGLGHGGGDLRRGECPGPGRSASLQNCQPAMTNSR